MKAKPDVVLERMRKIQTRECFEARGTMCGFFVVPKEFVQQRCGRHDRADVLVMAYDGSGPADLGADWEHVSVSIPGKHRCPDWSEMCMVKDLFWPEEETVVQFHVPKSEHVNNHEFCLHLWRWRGGEFPRPSPLNVGIPYSKDGLIAVDGNGRPVDAAIVEPQAEAVQ